MQMAWESPASSSCSCNMRRIKRLWGDAVQVGGDNLCCRESVVHGQQVARVHDETFAVLQCGGSGVRDDDIGLIGGCNLGSADDFLFFSIDGIEFCFL